MHLSLTTWSFPELTLTEAAGVARALGIGAIDVSTKGRPGLDRAELMSDPRAAAERVRALGLPCANYYHHFGDTLAHRNLALEDGFDANLRDFEQAMTFADAAGISTVFALPGIVNPGQSRRDAFEVAVRNIGALLEVAKDHRARFCIEPIVKSFAESPALVLELVERTGVALALDLSHFACLGHTQESVDPLAAHAAHVHLRQARAGRLQAPFAQGTINFPALFGVLRDAGYGGALAIEVIHTDFMACRSEDVLSETVRLRDCFTEWAGAACRPQV